MSKKLAYIPKDPESYQKLNISPGAPAQWEDGIRTGMAPPGTYEWWYFDCHLDDGTTMVIIFFVKPLIDIQKKLSPLILVDIDFPDGRHVHREYHGSANEFKALKERCHVEIGRNYFKGDLENYEIFFSDEELTINVNLVRKTPSWRPETGYQYFGEMQENALAWLIAVPDGDIQAQIVYQGSEHNLTGTGYHDHNWGNNLMPKLIHHWYWARIKIGDYVIICALVTAEKAYNYDSIPMIMIAKNGKILADDGEKLKLFESDRRVNKDFDKPFSNELKFIYQDENEKYEITFIRHKDITAERLADKGMKGFKRFLAKLIRYDGTYFRFLGEAKLEYYVDGQCVESLETNNAIWELMFFGKGKTP